MTETGKPEICLWVCWGGGALAGLLAFLRVIPEFSLLAALMFCAALAVLLGLAVSRIFCTGATAQSSAGKAETAIANHVKEKGGGAGQGAGTRKNRQGDIDMANSNSGLSCTQGCWLLAGGIGLLALILMLVFGSSSFITSLFIAGVIFVVLGLAFGYMFCRETTAFGGAEEDAPAARREAAEPDRAGDPAPAVETGEESPVKSGTGLPGEEELASRKGEWSYQGDASGGASEPAAASAPEPAASSAAEGGAKPEGLSQARGGQPDDLKQIKGVGPKLEQLLHTMGFFHYDQIAGWGPEEVAWVDENLKGFKGRVTRDNWVEQAKTLAAGGETEFSKRARDGDVY